MILKTLMDIGAKNAGATTLHCNSQTIVGRIVFSNNDSVTLVQADKNVEEYGPKIRGTVSLKPGLGFYKWEHLLACKCVSARAGTGLVEDTTNAANLNKIVAFTEQVLYSCNLPKSQETLGVSCNLACRPECRCCKLPDLHYVLDALNRLANLETREQLRAIAIEKNFPRGGIVTLEIGLNTPQWFQQPELLAYWGSEGYSLSDNWGKEVREGYGTCLVTGQHGQLQRESIVLTGWRESQPRLAAFNCAAYRSRGLAQTFNAPISEEAADLITKGWQYLLHKEGENAPNSHKLEDQIFVFWGNPIVEVWGERARDPVVWKDVLLSAQKGERQYISPEGFHMLGIGKHTSNAYVISWLDQDANQTAKHILRWGQWLTIHDKQPHHHTLTDLIMALRPRKDWYRRVNGGKNLLDKHEMRLWRDLLHLSYGEGQIPPYVLHRLVERFSTELETVPLDRATVQRYNQSMKIKTNVYQKFPLDRLVLLNICLCSLNDLEEINVNVLDNLDAKKRNAYNAGQIFNWICYAQYSAIGETGKTLLASNARLAASRPNQIIPELITRLNDVYLPKLNRDKRGLAITISKEIGELMRMTELASSHTSDQMGWFWKGFYHRASKQTDTDKNNGDNA